MFLYGTQGFHEALHLVLSTATTFAFFQVLTAFCSSNSLVLFQVLGLPSSFHPEVSSPVQFSFLHLLFNRCLFCSLM